MTSASISSSRTVCLWMFRGDSLWDLLLGSSDGWCTCPSCSFPSLVGCKLLNWNVPGLSSVVWQVHSQPSHEWLASTYLWLCPSFHVLTCWCGSANDLHVVTQASSALLLVSGTDSSKNFLIAFILDRNSSNMSSNLGVGHWCPECYHKQSALLFHLCKWYIVLGQVDGSCSDPSGAVANHH